MGILKLHNWTMTDWTMTDCMQLTYLLTNL